MQLCVCLFSCLCLITVLTVQGWTFIISSSYREAKLLWFYAEENINIKYHWNIKWEFETVIAETFVKLSKSSLVFNNETTSGRFYAA